MPGSLRDDQVTLDDIDTPTDNQSGGDGVNAVVVVHKPTRTELADTVSSCLAHTAQLVADGVDAEGRASIASKIKTGDIEVSSRGRILPDTDCAFAIDIEGREHVAHAVKAACNDGLDFVVVDNLATLGESIKGIRDRVDRVVSAGAELHVTETATTIDSDTAGTVLGVLDGLNTAGVALQREARIRDVRDWLDGRDPTDGGRAPLGFEWNAGELVTVDEFDQVRAVLDLVDVGEMSKRHAAERLGASPRTVTRALSDDRRGLYGLDDEE